jgi:lysophospholipase L1-like esterase
MRIAHPLAFAVGAAVLTGALLLTAALKAQQSTAAADARDHALATDFGQLARYQAANQQLPPATVGEPRVIFYGDSITDAWKLDTYFPGKGYINRGISGQTTPQMLVRFRQDVIDLQPKVVVVLAGTNDLAGNTGPMTVEQTEANYTTLAELARLHHIALVFSSVMPVNGYIHPEIPIGRPPAKILALDAWLKSYCRESNLIYLDYFSAMLDPSGQLQKALSYDGLHPNDAGYRVMTPLAQKAIVSALSRAETEISPK